MTEAGDQPARRNTVPALAWWLGHAFVVLSVAIATRRFTLFLDDFVFLGQGRGALVSEGAVHEQDLTLDYLREPLFEHFSPITRLLFWLIARTDEPQTWARLLVLALVALLVVSVGLLCRAILGRSLEALLVTMISVQGLVVVRLSSWTTASFNIMLATAACALAFAAAVHYLRHGRSRWYAVASAGCFVVALLDYELAMFFPVFVGVWFLLCVAPSLGLRPTIARLRQTLYYWATLAVLNVAALLNFFLGYRISSLPSPGPGDFFATVWHSLWQGLFPAWVGVWQTGEGPAPLGVLAVVAWLVVIGLALWRVGPRILGPVVLGLLGWLMCVGTVAWGRTVINGTFIGVELFYVVLALLPLAVAVCEGIQLASSPSPSQSSVSRGVGHRAPVRWRVPAVLALVTVLTAVSVQVNSRSVTDPNGFASMAREVTTNFLADVDSRDEAPSVVGTPVNAGIALPGFFPYNYSSRSLGLLTDRVSWDTGGDDLHLVSGSGHLVEVGIAPRRRAWRIDMAGERGAIRQPGTDCFEIAGPDSVVRMPLRRWARGENLVISLEGSIDRDSAVLPSVQAGSGRAPATGTATQWQEGDLHAVLYPDVGTVRGVYLKGLVADATLCVDALVVGSLVTAD